MALIVEQRDRVLTITFNRPEAMNALAPSTLIELGEAWTAFRDDPKLWVAIVTGAGDRAFCAGADLKELIPLITSGKGAPRVDAFLRQTPIYKPIIAAVNGHALAGGTELLLATDIRYASPNATFGLAEARWGLLPGGGGTQRLPKQIPYCHAMEILLAARPIPAERALAMGLINEIVPADQLLDRAWRMAETLCENGPLAVRAIKEAAQRGFVMPLEQGLVIEDFLAARVFRSQDAKEGPRAFAEKRKPNFQGR